MEVDKKPVSNKFGAVVFPGDEVPLESDVRVRIGQGLLQQDDVVTATKCGILSQQSFAPFALFIDNKQKRYLPTAEDMVVGTVVEKHSENYKIDIGTSQPAVLPAEAFEGASRRNRPNIPVGALVYARVILANKDMETELACTSPHFKKDWVTGLTLFGELVGGYSFKCSLSLARRLLVEDSHVLNCLGAHFAFEIAVGVNGQVWLESASPVHTIVISSAILNSEHMSEAQTSAMVKRLVAEFNR